MPSCSLGQACQMMEWTRQVLAFLMSLSSDECAYASGARLSSICRSSGIDKTNGLSLVSVVFQAVYSTEAVVFEELGAVDPFTDAVDWAIQAPLQNRFKDLPEADMKEILYQRMWENNSYKAHEDHMMLYEALEKSMNCDHTDELLKDLAEACRKKKK
nr:hypothetical protein [Tanacetum cinerariifolium]